MEANDTLDNTPLIPIRDEHGPIPGAFHRGDELVLTAATYDCTSVARMGGIHPETLKRGIRSKRIKAAFIGQGYRIGAAETRRILTEGI